MSACFAVSWHVFTINPWFSLTRIDNCFNVFSKSKAFHGIIFQEKPFTITFCKPCKLVVKLWTFIYFSVQKVYNGFKLKISYLTKKMNVWKCHYNLYKHLNRMLKMKWTEIWLGWVTLDTLTTISLRRNNKFKVHVLWNLFTHLDSSLYWMNFDLFFICDAQLEVWKLTLTDEYETHTLRLKSQTLEVILY